MRVLSLALLRVLPLAAAADEPFALPDGCTGFLTVQMKSCLVSHHFTCEIDPPGLRRRIDVDVDGISYAGAIDEETQWIHSFHLRSGHAEELEASPTDRASFSALIETGVDSYDFWTESEEIGETHYVGVDRLTGEQVVIDGVTLDRTDYEIRSYDADNNEMWSSTGQEYISRDYRLFFSGISTYVTPEETFETDDSPVEFILPGEPGFLSLNPKYGCGATMSSYRP